MSIGTCWKAGSWATPSWKTGSWKDLGGVVTLALAPTRVATPRRVARVGDAIDFTETLRGYDSLPQNLTGASAVKFTLDAPDGTPLVSNGNATIVNAAAGQVTYRVPVSVAVPVGVCTWRYRVVWDADTALSFPDDSNGELTVIADLP